jgi:lysozyme
MNMQYGKDGLNLTKDFEKCRLMPYLDGGGVPTDGWGNTHKVVMGVPITQEKADADLLCNVQDAVDAVNDYVAVVLTQAQFDALVDFVFNVGVQAFKQSTLLRKLNLGDYQGAHDQFDRWNMDNGKVVNGLQRRRDEEQKLWEGTTNPPSPTTQTVQADPIPVVITEATQTPAPAPTPAWLGLVQKVLQLLKGKS